MSKLATSTFSGSLDKKKEVFYFNINTKLFEIQGKRRS